MSRPARDRSRDAWVYTEVTADRCYIASSGVISFLNAERKPADAPEDAPAPTAKGGAKGRKKTW